MSATHQKSIETVAELLKLPPGWDSYSAKPIDPRAAAEATRILSGLSPAIPSPSVVPMTCAGIQLEWHGNGVDLEIHITPEGEARFSAESLLKGSESVLGHWLQLVAL